MLNRFVISVIALFCCASAGWAAMDHMTTPLMVVRFNQPHVYYEQPLFNAFSRAAQSKVDVRFAVINYFPPRAEKPAMANFQRVLATIRQMGVPNNRVDIRSEPAPDLNYSEIHIYVR